MTTLRILCFYAVSSCICNAQPENIKNIFPAGTVYHHTISYAGDTLRKHTLDVFLPPNAKANTPVVVWVHGGGWIEGNKYNDMGYMKNTLRGLLDSGYALATIEYRLSTDSIFPAQIRDCYQALEFLSNHAKEYHLDKTRMALIGFSAGGHLASLLGLSLNNSVPAFYPTKKRPAFTIKAVLDFYGPSDFMLFFSKSTPDDVDNPVVKLLGASPLVRPDISKLASPVTYVDAGDPPFFIVQGEKDESVSSAHSYLLKGCLDQAKVKNELTIVKDAPHYGVMFDTEEIRVKLIAFLKIQL